MTKKRLKLVFDNGDSGYIQAEQLHTILAPAQLHEITFRSEKLMRSYRSLLYSINRQGDYRYRSMRSEGSMWSLYILRLK